MIVLGCSKLMPSLCLLSYSRNIAASTLNSYLLRDRHFYECALYRGTQKVIPSITLLGRDSPNFDGLVKAATDEGLAIGAKGQRINNAEMSTHSAE